ncbi:MAG: molybdopterin-binding protein, partial [Pseudomonadota bacterium]
MIQTQRLTAALTPLDTALELLCGSIRPVDPIDVPLADSVGFIAAAMPPLRHALPAFNIAVANGWALRARDIVGASPYSPLPLAASPVWVEAGDRLPVDCDCVLDSDLIEQAGPLLQVVAEAVPGQGIRRTGEDFSTGSSVIPEGRRVSSFDVLAARAAGLDRLQIRSPRVRVIDVSSTDGNAASWQFISEFVNAAG